MVFVHYFYSGRTLQLAPLLMHMAIIIIFHRQQRTVEHHNSLPGEANVDTGISALQKYICVDSIRKPNCKHVSLFCFFGGFRAPIVANWKHACFVHFIMSSSSLLETTGACTCFVSYNANSQSSPIGYNAPFSNFEL